MSRLSFEHRFSARLRLDEQAIFQAQHAVRAPATVFAQSTRRSPTQNVIPTKVGTQPRLQRRDVWDGKRVQVPAVHAEVHAEVHAKHGCAMTLRHDPSP